MSLLVWLPLTQNNSNQGLLNLTPTNQGTISFINGGKLGKCLSAGNSSQTTNGISYNSTLVNELGTKFSASIWVKPLGNHVHYNGTFVSSGNWNAKRWAFGVNQNNTQVDVFGNGHNKYVNCSVPVNQWTHLVCTNDNGTVKLYKNGEYVTTTTITAGLESDAGGNFTVGRETYASGYFSFNGNINDLRIYNHILSDKEIKELSKGLVCHYPLNNNGGGQPNLYNFESVASLWKTGSEELILVDATDDVYGNVLKITTPSSVDSLRIYRGVKNVWEADTNFTVSFLAKASKTAVLKIERSRTDYAPDVTVGTTWKRYSTVIPCSATTTGGGLGIQTSTASADIYLTQIKVELGDKATVYCPNEKDSHYIPLGYDSTTEYDVSGNGYNGTKNGTLTYSSDTARYSVSTLFTDGLLDKLTAPIVIGDGTQITISIWVKSLDGSDGTGGYHMPININSSEFEFSIPTTGKFRQGFIISGSRKVADYGSTNLLDKKWHMISATFDGTNIKRYIDGVLVDTTAASGTLSTDNKNIYIGTYGGSTQYASKNILESDLRIYATALSAEDIKELYSTAATIDKSGNIYSYEFKEV